MIKTLLILHVKHQPTDHHRLESATTATSKVSIKLLATVFAIDFTMRNYFQNQKSLVVIRLMVGALQNQKFKVITVVADLLRIQKLVYTSLRPIDVKRKYCQSSVQKSLHFA